MFFPLLFSTDCTVINTCITKGCPQTSLGILLVQPDKLTCSKIYSLGLMCNYADRWIFRRENLNIT